MSTNIYIYQPFRCIIIRHFFFLNSVLGVLVRTQNVSNNGIVVHLVMVYGFLGTSFNKNKKRKPEYK